MRHPRPLPPELAERPFLVREALDAGLPQARMHRKDLAAPMRGIRVPADSDAMRTVELPDETLWEARRTTVIARAHAVALGVTELAVFSHATAALIQRMPLPERLARSRSIHLSVGLQQDRPRVDGVQAHLAPRDVRRPIWCEGLRVTTPVATWIALARSLTMRELVVIGDHLVRRRDPDTTVAGLEEAVRRAAGRHGVRRLRAALGMIRARTDSPRETELRLLLTDHGLPEPEVNLPIVDRYGRLIRHGDLVYPERKVLVEYDGEVHRTDDVQYRVDKELLDRILAEGWVVVHVLKAHMRAPRQVAARVHEALTRASPAPSPVAPAVRVE